MKETCSCNMELVFDTKKWRLFRIKNKYRLLKVILFSRVTQCRTQMKDMHEKVFDRKLAEYAEKSPSNLYASIQINSIVRSSQTNNPKRILLWIFNVQIFTPFLYFFPPLKKKKMTKKISKISKLFYLKTKLYFVLIIFWLLFWYDQNWNWNLSTKKIRQK